jgi:hypothetical protein
MSFSLLNIGTGWVWMSGDFLAEFLVIFGHGMALGKGKEKSLVKLHVEVQLSFVCAILRYPHSWMEIIPGFSQLIIRCSTWIDFRDSGAWTFGARG